MKRLKCLIRAGQGINKVIKRPRQTKLKVMSTELPGEGGGGGTKIRPAHRFTNKHIKISQKFLIETNTVESKRLDFL